MKRIRVMRPMSGRSGRRRGSQNPGTPAAADGTWAWAGTWACARAGRGRSPASAPIRASAARAAAGPPGPPHLRTRVTIGEVNAVLRGIRGPGDTEGKDSPLIAERIRRISAVGRNLGTAAASPAPTGQPHVTDPRLNDAGLYGFTGILAHPKGRPVELRRRRVREAHAGFRPALAAARELRRRLPPYHGGAGVVRLYLGDQLFDSRARLPAQGWYPAEQPPGRICRAVCREELCDSRSGRQRAATEHESLFLGRRPGRPGPKEIGTG